VHPWCDLDDQKTSGHPTPKEIAMKVGAGNISLEVDELGTGEPALVFLHYWGGSRRTWTKVMDGLKDTYRCVAYDQRGWGGSDAPAEGYALADLAEDALSLIEAMGLRKYVLVGHSMGGKVAQLVASRRPEGLMGLVLVAPAPPTPVHFPEPMREQQVHAYDSRENVLQAIAFLTARPPAAEIVEQIVEDSLSGSPGAKFAWPAETIAEDISAEVSRIATPTLVLAGEHDRIDSVEQHRREVLPRILDSRLEVIAGSGHLSPIDEPEQLIAAISRFVGTLAASAEPAAVER
jgi:pimeloyl-ACP methyl ester carboxylesterase